jgi:hypothetical protein
MGIVRIVVVVASCAVAAGCGGSTAGIAPNGDAGPDANAVTEAQACADNAHQRCTRLQTCSATDVQIRYGSESACETGETASCLSTFTAPSNGKTAAHVEACAQAYPGWSCTDYLNDENIPPDCQQQTGPFANGTACVVSGQCQTGFCALAPGAACGTCTALPAAGDSCAALTTCGAGLTCTSDTMTCVVLAAQGAACGKGAPCGAGLSCVGADAATSTKGTCQSAVETSGAACDPTLKTGPGCDRNAGLVCNGTSKTCQAVVVAAAGQPCGDVSNQTAYCSTEGACKGASGSTPGVCTAAAAEGAACDTGSGTDCITPGRCVGANGDAGITGTCEYAGAGTCGG